VSHDASYGCVLEFDTDEPEFRRGWECGHVYTELRRIGGMRQFMVHSDTVEMLMRIAEALDFEFTADVQDEVVGSTDWVAVDFRCRDER
jgi:uncharacterized protein (DUF169 family)